MQTVTPCHYFLVRLHLAAGIFDWFVPRSGSFGKGDGSQLELAVVVDASSLRLSIVEEEVGVSVGSRDRCNGESNHVHGVFVNAEESLVVPGEGGKENSTGGGVNKTRSLSIGDEALVLSVELVGARVHVTKLKVY